MATAETARLIASLELKDNMSKGLNSASASLGKLESKAFRVGQTLGKGINNAVRNIQRIGIAGGVALAGAVAFGIRSLGDLARTEAQTNAVIESTGGKAGVSAAEVRKYAEALEKLSTVDDKVIQDGENMLLTFTGISKDVFPQATKAALNMAVAMAGGNVEQVDMKASAIQLGKALNDPIKGITALRKVGVAFTEAQIKQIKALVKSGDILGAQTIILKELEVEFGNAAEAAGKGPEASWRRLQDVGEDLSQSLARGLLPVLTRAADWLSTKLADPAVVKVIDDIGASLARAGDSALKFLDTVDFKGIADSLGTAVGFAQGVVGAFLGMPDWVKQAVLTGWGLNKLTGGAVVDFGKLVFDQFASRGATPANPLFVADVAGGLGGLGGAAGAAAGIGTGVAVAAIAAAVAGTVIASLPFIERNNAMADKGLNQAEIAAVKYYQSDQATQQAALKHGLQLPTKADFESGLAKLQTGEMFGPPRPAKGAPRPAFVDSPRTSAASLKDLEAILARGRAAGFKPTFAAAQATNQKNLERLASAQIAKTEAVRAAVTASDTRSELAGIRMAITSSVQKPPITNVYVNVAAGDVQRRVVIRNRTVPPAGSRESFVDRRGFG